MGELLDEAARPRAEHRRREEPRAAADLALRDKERAMVYQRRLEQLAAEDEVAWSAGRRADRHPQTVGP
ncbi:hypothetical protein [Actinocatenispora thailandica]|uniref:hypothetical protein n=1 Tax=Actinocatenispora thailandica TaxID=227318 RepID=UPI001951B07B|nr:hypothetical protein [Actinocatenispora thailandica]